MKKLPRLSLVYLQMFLSLVCGERIICQSGVNIVVPCANGLQDEVVWNRGTLMILRYKKEKKTFGSGTDKVRFNIPGDSTNLEIKNVKLSDSGNYTCEKGAEKRTTQVVVLEVEVLPSMNLLVSEDLKLTIAHSSEVSLRVSWLKGQQEIEHGLILRKYNLKIEDQGIYTYRVLMENGEAKSFEVKIEVSGFSYSPSVVYTSGRQAITIPWKFNFNVQQTPLENNVRVVEGNITSPSRRTNSRQLIVENGAACWKKPCDTKKNVQDLNYSLTNPESGTYQMAIVLELKKRQKHLARDVCVANLTASVLENIITMESNVTLQCNINCLDKGAKLCWYYNVIKLEVCGPPEQKTFIKDITAVPETLGNWTCSVVIGQKNMVSVNLTVEITPGFFHPSNPILWVTVAVGVLILLFTVVIITVMTARCRRMRRARYRAWLLDNLHQHRVCECNGFAPKRLRDNI